MMLHVARNTLCRTHALAAGMLALAAIWVLPSHSVCAQPPEVPDGVKYSTDVVYGTGGDTALHLDIAHPEAPESALPCVVVIHGGAWRQGDKSAHTDLVLELAKRGYVAATVQYRFCPEHTFPAQIEDVKCAVRFLRAHTADWNIDPKRIAAVGFSAGAHLSMLLATMGPDDGFEGQGGSPDRLSKVRCAVSFAGPTDLDADDLPPVSQTLVRDFLGGPIAEKAEVAQQASPIEYLSRDDGPLLLFQGTKDPLVPHTQATKMADAMTAAGVDGRIELLIGAGHGWDGARRERSLEQMFEFLEQHLHD